MPQGKATGRGTGGGPAGAPWGKGAGWGPVSRRGHWLGSWGFQQKTPCGKGVGRGLGGPPVGATDRGAVGGNLPKRGSSVGLEASSRGTLHTHTGRRKAQGVGAAPSPTLSSILLPSSTVSSCPLSWTAGAEKAGGRPTEPGCALGERRMGSGGLATTSLISAPMGGWYMGSHQTGDPTLS